MKKLLLILLLLCPITVAAQEDRHHFTFPFMQGGGQQGGYPAYRFRRLAADPATCTGGDVYFNYVTPAYRKCETTNTWTDFGAGPDVVDGPASATDNAVARFDGTTGKLVQNSAVIIADTTGNISGPQKLTLGTAAVATGSLEFNGTTSGTVTVKPADAAGTWTLTLPANDGDADQYLKTNGSGVTSWAAAIGGSTGATDNAVLRANGAGGSTAQASNATLSDDLTLDLSNGSTDSGAVLAYGTGNRFGFMIVTFSGNETSRLGLNQFSVNSSTPIAWTSSSTSADSSLRDTALTRSDAAVVRATNASTGGGAVATGAASGQPTCNVTNRGAMWTVFAAGGASDTFQVCMKSAADAYAWRTVFTAP